MRLSKEDLVSSSWYAWHVTECNTEKFMKKVRGENSEKDIEAALQRLDRLSLHEGLAAGAQALQIASKMKSGLFPLCDVLIYDRRTGALNSICR